MIGPKTEFSRQLHAAKYRQQGESFDDYCVRYARTTADDERHFRKLLEGLRTQAILPAGRQQRAVGWPFQTTAFNCFCAATIPDSMEGIMTVLKDGMLTLRSGGGCGWDFSTLRPEGWEVRGLGEGAKASGPVSFMRLWNAGCETIMSAGERRGAMMGVLRIDHPDVMKFVRAKRNSDALTNFNVSLAVTDAFMEALESDGLYDLQFGGRVTHRVRAQDVWAAVMENNWDWAEPGVLFIDRINRMNPLAYCETIATTNPCAEQPLPPNGACLLLSHNLVKYLVPCYSGGGDEVDLARLAHDVGVSVRACDNVFERTTYPLEAQKKEALAKRRMGVGVTGMANALEICGYRYGSDDYLHMQSAVLRTVRDAAYQTSIDMARTKGPFPLFDADRWLASGYAQTLPDEIRHDIKRYGLRNGLLLSIAPTGTISMAADNVSSGVEPPYSLQLTATVRMPDGERQVELSDWALEEYGVRGLTAEQVSPADHVRVLCNAQGFVDSSISKTINLRGAKGEEPDPGETSFAAFKDVYLKAYRGGAKGCTTFNSNGKRFGVRVSRDEPSPDGEACTFDSATGAKICDS